MTTGKPALTEAQIDDAIAKADGVIGAAGHVVSDPRARQIIRRKIAGEITDEEADRLLIELEDDPHDNSDRPRALRPGGRHPMLRQRFPNSPSRTLLWLFAALALLLALSYILSEQVRHDVAEPPPGSPSLIAPGDLDADYYEILGAAVKEHDPAPGEISYCPLDKLGRAVCAYGSLTPQLRQGAQDRGRQDIRVNPAGWPSPNPQVKIPALEDVEGSKAYSGWLWNRSHLLADSLGGDAVRENLVTGTRTQNVGSAQTNGQYSGGMAFTELLARQYLDTQTDAECPLYYAAAPVYTGDELVPRTVLVDVASCDGSLDLRVEVSNTAAGFAINYADGSHAKD